MREGKTYETEIRMQEVDEETVENYSNFWKSQSLYYFRYLHGVIKKNQDFLLQTNLGLKSGFLTYKLRNFGKITFLVSFNFLTYKVVKMFPIS